MSLQIDEIDGSNVTENQVRDLSRLCAEAKGDANPTNWNVDEWEVRPESLLYCLLKEGRFSGERGRLFLMRWGDVPVAVSGVYRSPWNRDFALGGVRTFTSPHWRTRLAREQGKFFHSDHLLPIQYEWAKRQGCRAYGLTFNDATLRLLQFLRRIARGDAVYLGLRPSAETVEFYSHFVLHPAKVRIQFVEQYLYYRPVELNSGEGQGVSELLEGLISCEPHLLS